MSRVYCEDEAMGLTAFFTNGGKSGMASLESYHWLHRRFMTTASSESGRVDVGIEALVAFAATLKVPPGRLLRRAHLPPARPGRPKRQRGGRRA